MSHIVKRYFDAFNAGDVPGMLACLSDDVTHHVNQGEVRTGKDAFAEFCAMMNQRYAETVSNLVIFEAPDQSRAAAEYTVKGTYMMADPGQPPAHGQPYTLSAGSFFDLKDGLITRVTTRFSTADWLRQVS